MKLLPLILLALAIGCAAKPSTSTPTGSHLAKASVHIDDIFFNAQGIEKQTIGEPRFLARQIIRSSIGASGNIVDATIADKAKDAAYAKLERDYYDLDTSFPVVAWRRIKLIALVWVGLGIAGAILSGFTTGLPFVIGTAIIRFLPFANLFVWLREWLKGRA